MIMEGVNEKSAVGEAYYIEVSGHYGQIWKMNKTICQCDFVDLTHLSSVSWC